MIEVYKLKDGSKFHKYDTWDNGKFSGPLSGLDIKESEIEKQFNTTYYRTVTIKAAESKPKDEVKDKPTEKFEINIKEL
jgi:hypothetical protein